MEKDLRRLQRVFRREKVLDMRTLGGDKWGQTRIY
jgi:hypothetical protein